MMAAALPFAKVTPVDYGPDEAAMVRYRPYAAQADQWRWTSSAKTEIKDYNLLDLGI